MIEWFEKKRDMAPEVQKTIAKEEFHTFYDVLEKNQDKLVFQPISVFSSMEHKENDNPNTKPIPTDFDNLLKTWYQNNEIEDTYKYRYQLYFGNGDYFQDLTRIQENRVLLMNEKKAEEENKQKSNNSLMSLTKTQKTNTLTHITGNSGKEKFKLKGTRNDINYMKFQIEMKNEKKYYSEKIKKLDVLIGDLANPDNKKREVKSEAILK